MPYVMQEMRPSFTVRDPRGKSNGFHTSPVEAYSSLAQAIVFRSSHYRQGKYPIETDQQVAQFDRLVFRLARWLAWMDGVRLEV